MTLPWCHAACITFFVEGEFKLYDDIVLPVTKKERKGRGNELSAPGWKIDAQTCVCCTLSKDNPDNLSDTRPLAEQVKAFHVLFVFMILQENKSLWATQIIFSVV